LKLRTFDLFDTLIARRCVSPLLVYQQVENKAKLPGLADARSQAGHQLWLSQTPHNTADIYQLALRALPQTPLNAQELAQLEYDVELQECIPVLQALSQLDRQAVIISDMHHPLWFLEKLYASVARDVVGRWLPSFYVSNQDKHQGVIWQQLSQQKRIVNHLGDNLHSDVETPRAHGHQATLFSWTAPESMEQKMFSSGLNSIARASRSVRLQCVPHPADANYPLLYCMACYVVPLLAMGSLLLREFMRRKGKTHLVFVGRDGAVWQSIFDAMFGQVPHQRLALSRELMRRSPQTCVAMIRSCVTEQSLVVDLAGSGASWAQLEDDAGFDVFFPIFHLISYPSWRSTQGIVLDSLIDFSRTPIEAIYALEALCEESYSSHATADWIGIHPQAGLARFHPPSSAGMSVGDAQMADVLQGVIQVAGAELRLEIARAHEQISTKAILTLMQELFSQLSQAFPSVSSRLNFSVRNSMLAQSLKL
jgi:hypothetical protein